MTTTADIDTWASALYAAYASGAALGPIPPLEEQTPAVVGRWRTVADTLLARLAPDQAIVDRAVAWRNATVNLAHAPDAPARVHADQELIKAVDASGR